MVEDITVDDLFWLYDALTGLFLTIFIYRKRITQRATTR